MPPYNVKLKVNANSNIMVDGAPAKETGWIDGTHAFKATLTGVAAGGAEGAGGAAPASITVTINVSHNDSSNIPVPEITVAIE
jgi:hypothetical protein